MSDFMKEAKNIREYLERAKNNKLYKMVNNKVREIIMNKENILQEIKNTEDSIKNLSDKMKKLKGELNKPENGRWRPEYMEDYWFVDSCGHIQDDNWYDGDNDNYKFKSRNCFKTKEEAQLKADYIKTHYELMDIADELNKGEKIDWYNDMQNKFYFYLLLNYKPNQGSLALTKNGNVIYCLNDTFISVALSRIGEDRLKAYLTYSEQ